MTRLGAGPRPPGAVLLDRDGTLITETGYLLDPARLVLIPGAAAAVARLNAARIPVALVTNQSAVGRGWLDEGGLERIHVELARQLAREGAHLDLVLSAFEHPTEGVGRWRSDSPRRKPNPGMLIEALEAFGVPAERAWTIGDGARDLVAAQRAGTSAILVRTGKGEAELERALDVLDGPFPVARDLAAAVAWLLGDPDAALGAPSGQAR